MIFKLYANCIPIKGAKGSIIVDFENESYISIPNLMFEILSSHKGETVSAIKSYYNNKYDKGIDSHFAEFINLGIGFYPENPDFFPEININFTTSSVITNAIFEISSILPYSLSKIMMKLHALGCHSIEFRCSEVSSLDLMKEVFDCFLESRFRSYQMIFKYERFIDLKRMEEFILQYKRISQVMFWGVPEKDIMGKCNDIRNDRITFSACKSLQELEKKNKNSLLINIQLFLEAHSHNTGLNGKVCIDLDGNIKNYLSHNKTFGNVMTHEIEDVVRQKGFQSIWNISNNNIEKCKDCQFKYCCVSNSDIEFRKNGNFKVLDCDFDPYRI